MDLDAKHRVLYAIYTEYQKDLPAMNGVTATGLQMSMDVFNVAVDKLQGEGMIRGAIVVRVDQEAAPVKVALFGTSMTREGIEYVEKKLEIEKGRTGKEKVQALAEKFAAYGWSALADFAARVFVEVAKQVSI